MHYKRAAIYFFLLLPPFMPCLKSLATPIELWGQPIGSEVYMKLRLGEVQYEEDVSLAPIQSDWDAPYLSLDLIHHVTWNEHWILNVRGGGWISEERTESWEENDRLIQEDELRVLGADFSMELGYVLPYQQESRFTPYLGFGYRYIEFERSDFVIVEQGIFDPNGVDEEFQVFSVQGAVELEHRFSTQLTVFGRSSAGYVTYHEADNSTFGTVDSSGGLLLEAEISLLFVLSDDHEIGIGAYYDLQDLDGEKRDLAVLNSEGRLLVGQLELPDNELERWSVQVEWRVKL